MNASGIWLRRSIRFTEPTPSSTNIPSFQLRPERVALDSVSELKVLSQTSVRYRREILGLKQFLTGRRCTVLSLTTSPHARTNSSCRASRMASCEWSVRSVSAE